MPTNVGSGRITTVFPDRLAVPTPPVTTTDVTMSPEASPFGPLSLASTATEVAGAGAVAVAVSSAASSCFGGGTTGATSIVSVLDTECPWPSWIE